MFIIKEKGGINMINVNKVGEFITLKRKEKGLTQQQLANKLSVSFQAVSKWENGTSDPSTSNLFALAKLYGISVEELIKDVK